MKAFFSQLKEFFGLFSSKDRRQLGWVFVGMLITGLFEVAGVGSVVPFLAVAADPAKAIQNLWIHPVYVFLGFTSPHQFVLALGLAVIAFLFLSNAVKGTVYYFTIRFTKVRMTILTSRLFRHFLLQPYHYFLKKNSSDILKNILDDLPKTLDGVLDPLLDLLSKAVIVVGLVFLIMATDFWMAIGLTIVFGSAYLVLFSFVRKSLGRRSQQSNELAHERFRTVNEALGGIKDVKFAEIEKQYLAHYEKLARVEFLNDASREVLSSFPKYFFEVIAFGGIIAIVLIYLTVGKSLAEVLPVLGLYAFAGYRLMPYMQQIFADMAKMKFAIVRLRSTLLAFSEGEPDSAAEFAASETLIFKQRLVLQGVTFQYPGTEQPVLRSLSLTVPCLKTIGLVGSSGAGKSTLVDLLLGLLPIPRASIFVDGQPLHSANLSSWKSMVGYVPQQIYLSDASIAQNIAFGVPEADIDFELVVKVSKLANLHEFIVSELPQQYQTLTGERGVRLSGGQRQRIGIARALYRNPQVLILDEATSALDGITESAIMEAIHSLGHSMTMIIIAHRLTTLKECDEIFVLADGSVVDQGNYSSLMERNFQFREMAGEGRSS